MSVLRFRRDRRQRDPFAADPIASPEPPAYDSRMDVDAKLAEIAAQARRQTATMARPPWTTAPQPAAPGLLAREARDWYGWDTTVTDSPPAHTRPYIPGGLGRERRMSPARATIREDLGGCLIFRDAVHAEFVRRDQVRGIRHDGGWLDSWTLTAERRLGGGYPELPDFRIGELMHAHFAGMLAMHVTGVAA